MNKIKKWPYILVCLLIILMIFIICIPRLKINLELKEINVNEEYQIKYTGIYRKEDVTSKVTVDSKIDNTKLGTYKVIFNYNNKKVTKNIKVVDKVAPVIELKNGNINVLPNNEFKDPGYTVIDNYDKDLKVKVSGNVDTKKEGTYELIYTTSDKSGNSTSVTRTVTVSGTSPLDMSIKDFSLDGYFENTILKETADAGQDYIKNIIFAGDSVPLYYVMSKHIKGTQLWHKEGLNSEAALVQPIYINHQTTDLTFVEAFKEYQPKMVILTLGMNSAGTMTPDYFISCYTKLIEQIKEVSPNTKLIIQSIPPVDSKLDESEEGLNNKKINIFNYRIAEMCSKLNIPFLNSAIVLKDENGECKKGYCYLEEKNYGVHQTKEGNDKVFNYIRTHAYN